MEVWTVIRIQALALQLPSVSPSTALIYFSLRGVRTTARALGSSRPVVLSMATSTAMATISVPVTQLLRCLAARQPLLGVSLTPTTTECALLAPPYHSPRLVAGGTMLCSEKLKLLVEQHQVG